MYSFFKRYLASIVILSAPTALSYPLSSLASVSIAKVENVMAVSAAMPRASALYPVTVA